MRLSALAALRHDREQERYVIVPDQEDQNCWCRCCNIVLAKGVGGGEEGLESKGEGSWFQARNLSGWEFVTMSKTSVL
jgi:hypothetical protein